MDHLIAMRPRVPPDAAARQTEATYRCLLHKLGHTYDGLTDAALSELADDLAAFVQARRRWLDTRPQERRQSGVDSRE